MIDTRPGTAREVLPDMAGNTSALTQVAINTRLAVILGSFSS